MLGMGSSGDREANGSDSRKETKQEKEARKLEKERIAREKERERSMREESVDGGFLVTQGVYTGIEDYNKGIVRQLMVRASFDQDGLYSHEAQIERRIAPFWRGLNDHSDSWTENQLVAAGRGLPIPAPDEIPTEELSRPLPYTGSQTKMSEPSLHSLTVPISSRSQSYNSDSSSNLSPSRPAFSLPAAASPLATSSSGSTFFRGRAKTLAALTTSSRNVSQNEMTPREMQLPKDPFVNGQRMEAYLYKDAAECPICFLYYPPYLNKTRCCDQAICSECFVQIKRPDPHPPEHGDPTAQPPPSSGPGLEATEEDGDDQLVSEPAACPFCVQPEFGITYEPPNFRRGLTYVSQSSTHPLANAASAMSSSSSLASSTGSGGQRSPTRVSRRRTTSLSATAPTVVTTDKVRPDWATKLSTARAHAARRSAAATALHTAAYLMGNRNSSSDARILSGYGRRGLLRRGSGADSPAGGTASTQLSMLALMSERYSANQARTGSFGEDGPMVMAAPPRGNSRRNRVDDLEDMMMMEAIRLSLAAEDERHKREEKEAKKEAKKKEKENKKADKVAKKAGVYQNSASNSSSALDTELLSSNLGRGKAIDRGNSGNVASEGSQTQLERDRGQLQLSDANSASLPYGTSAYRPSHLRNLSNVSSSASSMMDSPPASLRDGVAPSNSSFGPSPNVSGINIQKNDFGSETFSSAPPGGGAGTEPMFNFRSLAAMIGEEEKMDPAAYSEHDEDVDNGFHHLQRGESSTSDVFDAEGIDNAGMLGQSVATLKPDDAGLDAGTEPAKGDS